MTGDSYHGASDHSSAARAPGEDLTRLPPAPGPPGRSVYEPPRETPVHAVTDVLVVGGGPAGCAAALAARRLGAEVVLPAEAIAGAPKELWGSTGRRGARRLPRQRGGVRVKAGAARDPRRRRDRRQLMERARAT